jgi:hypothetical protein
LSPNHEIKDKREIREVQQRGKRKKMREKEGCENQRIVSKQVKFDTWTKQNFK